MIEGILLVATGFFVLVTLLPLWRSPAWWVRVWEFPRLQLGTLLAALLIALGMLLDYNEPWHALATAAVGASLVYQLWWIAPYTRLWHNEVLRAAPDAPGPRIRVMAANVLGPNRASDRLLALVREYRPDVLVTLETDQWWEAQLEQLAEDYPHSIRCPQDNLYGMHVYSRLPLEEPELCFLVEDDVPSMHARVRVNDALSVRMHFLHPAPPSPTENEESTERDVELLVIARSVQGNDDPIIVTGDLNDVAWAPTTRLFRKISGLLDPRVGRGMYNTFHAHHWFLRWPLDHFFHSAHFRFIRLLRLPDIGSDHFPVFIELQYDPKHTEQQHGLEAERDDQQQAEETINEAPVTPSDVPQPDAEPQR
ncbi:endonuclease/exonuclease/phosphatase family protein [Pseudomonas stutzeri]|nr:endonuclease/exonuclease/phosphatase family protein [Stutzerimonas stutzeri]MCQ4295164.1 endonuclease/exonuclease/phosphatase family protein [Stutzerimonas stutzeri]